MPKLNFDLIASNIREACEELERIEKSLTSDKLPSEDFLQVCFDHAFHHLNFAWNARHTTLQQATNLADRDFNLWSKFPRDINITQVSIPRPNRRSPKRTSGRRHRALR